VSFFPGGLKKRSATFLSVCQVVPGKFSAKLAGNLGAFNNILGELRMVGGHCSASLVKHAPKYFSPAERGKK